MASNAAETVIGAVVLAAAIGAGLFAARSTEGGGGAGYELVAKFRSAQGITVGTDVRLAGVKIGTVAGMELDPNSFRAVTTLRVQDGIQIPEDSEAKVASDGLLGGAYVEIGPGGSEYMLAPGQEFVLTQPAVSLLTLLARFASSAGDEPAE